LQPNRSEDFTAKLFRREAGFESLHAVDANDGNLPTVTTDERLISINIDLFKREMVGAAGTVNRLLSVLAQMAVRASVERDARPGGRLFRPYLPGVAD